MSQGTSQDRSVLDILVDMKELSSHSEAIDFLTDEISSLADERPMKVQQYMYAHLGSLVSSCVRSMRIDPFISSDMEVRTRLYQDEDRTRCALGVSLIPSPEVSFDEQQLLRDIVSALKDRGLHLFVNDVTLNSLQRIQEEKDE